jgi:hypothetical protein
VTPDAGRQDPRLVDLALRITDGVGVDWEAARQTAGDLDETLERLRQLERLAQEHLEPVEGAEVQQVAFTWGPLRAIEKLGAGAFGEVWRAWDPTLAREVALKLRHPDAKGSVTRWLDEARRLARVRHPNVLTVHGADVHDGRAGLWSDFVRGRTMEDLLRTLGPLGPDEAALAGVHLCSAIAAVHAAGLVHGDVKTRNVMREGAPGHAGGAGRIVLMDFGAAHVASSTGTASALSPLYAAPELLAGGRPSVASDVYALGVLLYRLVSGEFPVEAASVEELRERHAAGARVPLRERRPDLPAGFVRAIEQALASDPAARFASAATFERALDASRGGTASAAAGGKRLRTVGTLVFGAALASLAWVGVQQAPRLLAPEFVVRPAHPTAVARSSIVASCDEVRDSYGNSLRFIGDVDGDGRPEFAVGAPQVTGGAGRVEILSEAADGHFEHRWNLSGESEGDRFGFSLAGAGDLDGDGHPDLVVSAPDHGASGRRFGRVYIYRGGPGFPGQPWAVLEGSCDLANFGFALSTAGDVNGDGRTDLVVGAPTDSRAGSGSGRVFVYFGGTEPWSRPDLDFSTNHSESQFGVAVESGVDFDGDGVRDIVVGGNFDSSERPQGGLVWIFRGGRDLDGTPDLVLHPPGKGAWFGGSLLAPGDLDGDGEPDLAVGAEFANGFAEGAGAVFLFRCGPGGSVRPWHVLRGEYSGDSFGRSLAAADINGDGRPDLVVAAHRHDSGSMSTGAIYGFFGGPRMDEVCDWEVEGRQNFDQLGFAIASVPARDSSGVAGILASVVRHLGATSSQGGRILLYEFARYEVLRPRKGETLTGSTTQLAWTGSEPARIERSVDGGAHWEVVAARAGGSDGNSVTVALPKSPRQHVRWRLVPADPRWRGTAETADIALLR